MEEESGEFLFSGEIFAIKAPAVVRNSKQHHTLEFDENIHSSDQS